MRYEFEEREYWEFERGADEYLKIENFKDYELTERLAYEMAFRLFRKDYLNGDEKVRNFVSELAEAERLYEEEENPYPLEYVNERYFDWMVNKYYFAFSDNNGEHIMSIHWYGNPKDVDGHFFIIPSKDNNFLHDVAIKDTHGRVLHTYALFPERKVLPRIPKEKSKEISVKLNLALPKDELIAYISTLKDNFDKDISTISTSFDAQLIQSDVFDEIQKRRNASGKLPNAKKMAYADMFFIYDYLNAASDDEIDEAIGNIQDEIKDYYTQKIMEIENLDKRVARAKARNIDPKTIRRYYELMQDFIDNERYKELLTGEKLE